MKNVFYFSVFTITYISFAMNLLLAAQRKSVLVMHLFDMQCESISHSFLYSFIGHWSKNMSEIAFPNNEENTANEIKILVTIDVDITHIV